MLETTQLPQVWGVGCGVWGVGDKKAMEQGNRGFPPRPRCTAFSLFSFSYPSGSPHV
ncbi:hypothetical protein [Moorena producens]|uniref:hypothetical protein n=1 Tax=Moorena producens TaxID=1155739 RepID=UPI0013140293|nr:hypothetical protein [Moorena producens]